MPYCESLGGQDTLKAFYTDVLNQKRRTEVVYYEPSLVLSTSNSGLTTTTLYNYDHSVTTYEYSILIQPSLATCFKIRFGDSSHSVIDGSITDVNNFVAGVLISDCSISVLSSSRLTGRRNITQKCSFVNFTEIALLDSSDVCLYYATFPKIQYTSDMYSNIAFDINIA